MHAWQVYIEGYGAATPVDGGYCVGFREAAQRVLHTFEDCPDGWEAYGDISWTNPRDEMIALRVTRRLDGGVVWTVP